MNRLPFAVLLFCALPARADLFGVEDCFDSYRRSLSNTSSGPCALECPSGSADRVACFKSCRSRLLPGGDPPLSRRQVCVTQHLSDAAITRLCGLSEDDLGTEIRHNTRNEAPSTISIAVTTVCDDRQAAAQAAQQAQDEEQTLRGQLASLRESAPGDVDEALDRADLLSSKAEVLRDKGDAGLHWADRRKRQAEDAFETASQAVSNCSFAARPETQPAHCRPGSPQYTAHSSAATQRHAARQTYSTLQARRRQAVELEETVSRDRSSVAWLQRCFDSKMDDSAGERSVDQVREDVAHLGNARRHLLDAVERMTHDLTPRVETLAQRLRADVADGAERVQAVFSRRAGARQAMPFLTQRDSEALDRCRQEIWAVSPPGAQPQALENPPAEP